MPEPPLPETIERFLRQAHPAVIASLRADGHPHTAATWYDWEDGRILLNMDDTRLRLDYLRRDPRLSLTVIDKDNWYRHISLIAVVEEIYADEGLRDIDRLARRYLGSPYPDRDGPRTSAWARVERWHGWDATHAILSQADWKE